MPSVIMESKDNSYIMLPSAVVDRYINAATHSQLKVLLWLIKNAGKTADEFEIAAYLNISAEDLNDAIAFWVKNEVLIKKGERLSLNVSGYSMTDSPAYSGEVIAEKLKNDKRLAMLAEKASQLLGKLLSPSELSLILKLNDYEGLSPEVIILIIEHCVSNGQKGLRNIEKTAKNFSEMGIDTAGKAENYIKELGYRRSMEAKIASIIGAAGRPLTESEKKNIAVWSSEYKFSLDMIKKAYEITVDNTGKYSITYMSTILRSWFEKGFKTIEDADNEQKPRKKKKKEANFDISENIKNSWKIVQNGE